LLQRILDGQDVLRRELGQLRDRVEAQSRFLEAQAVGPATVSVTTKRKNN